MPHFPCLQQIYGHQRYTLMPAIVTDRLHGLFDRARRRWPGFSLVNSAVESNENIASPVDSSAHDVAERARPWNRANFPRIQNQVAGLTFISEIDSASERTSCWTSLQFSIWRRLTEPKQKLQKRDAGAHSAGYLATTR